MPEIINDITVCPECDGRSVQEGHDCNACQGGGLVCPPVVRHPALHSSFRNVAGIGRPAHTTNQVTPGVWVPGHERRVASREYEQPALNSMLRLELTHAGIEVVTHDEVIPHPEVFTRVSGKLGTWTLQRHWRYWRAHSEEGLELALADRLFAFLGSKARAGGDGACREPKTWAEDGRVKHYDLDSQDGLNAFAATIRLQLADEADKAEKIRMEKIQTARDVLRERDWDSYTPPQVS